jgi:hypothetical protein
MKKKLEVPTKSIEKLTPKDNMPKLLEKLYPEKEDRKRRIILLWENHYRINYSKDGLIDKSYFVTLYNDKYYENGLEKEIN